jgi:[acyl-carrier-protein] S-malonyltransferase
MESAAKGLAEILDATEMREVTSPVVANATALPVREAAEIRQTLKDQLLAQVRWEESMRWLVSEGFETAIELGPGTVLRGLQREIDRSLAVHSVGTPADLDRVVTAMSGASA